MQFESAEVEKRFRQHFHLRRVTQDRVFAVTQVAIVVPLTLRTAPQAFTPSICLLFWGTNTLSALILALSSASPTRYAALRPYILTAARVFYDLLCPQLVWQLAAHSMAGGAAAAAAAAVDDKASWPGFFLLWVTWTRWGTQLLTQVGYLLPFNLEALVTPFGVLLDMLNNRRLCRLLTVLPQPRLSFYRDAFTRMAHWLSVPLEVIFAAAPADSCGELVRSQALVGSAGGGGDGSGGGVLSPSSAAVAAVSAAASAAAGCAWDLCTALGGSGGDSGGSSSSGGSGGGSGSSSMLQELSASPDDVSTCYCESLFCLSQLLLSVALPLLLAGYAEQQQRRQFVRQQQAAAARRPHRRSWYRPSDLHISFDGLRLLALMVLLQFRVFLSLRFGVWQQYGWDGDAWAPSPSGPSPSEAVPAAAAPVLAGGGGHQEL